MSTGGSAPTPNTGVSADCETKPLPARVAIMIASKKPTKPTPE
jgi:hypothetical protein